MFRWLRARTADRRVSVRSSFSIMGTAGRETVLGSTYTVYSADKGLSMWGNEQQLENGAFLVFNYLYCQRTLHEEEQVSRITICRSIFYDSYKKILILLL